MIEIIITEEAIKYAKQKLRKVISKDNLDLSKFGSERHRILVGYIGEKLVMDYLSLKKDVDNFDFDLISKIISVSKLIH